MRKVTSFGIKEYQGIKFVVLIAHPSAGFQFPAGSVEEGESFADGACRELIEETGVTNFARDSVRLIHTEKTILPDNQFITLKGIDLTSAEDGSTRRIPRGWKVHKTESGVSTSTVVYREYQAADDLIGTVIASGTVDNSALTNVVERQFFVIDCQDHAFNRSVATDGQNFSVIWLPLVKIIEVHPFQKSWLDILFKQGAVL